MDATGRGWRNIDNAQKPSMGEIGWLQQLMNSDINAARNMGNADGRSP
jgi:hypothetical protein